MRLGPIVLAGLGVVVAVFPNWFDSHLASPMASAIAGAPVDMKLELWHGVNPGALAVLGLSAVTLALGFLVFVRIRKHLTFTTELAARLGRFGPARRFDAHLAAVYRGAGYVTRALQNGRLRWYLLITVLAAVAVLTPLVLATRPAPAWDPIRPLEAVALVLVVAGALVAAVTRSRLTAVVGLGVTGLAISLLFLLFGAPDLAITQIMVETLTVVLFVLVLCRGCDQPRPSGGWTRLRDLVPSLAAGATVTGLVLAASTVTHDANLAGWFAENSSPLAFGRNVVNVILVDFRALDTLGEITVVAVAALGVLALLRLRLGERAR
jgi:multicomponent Na+:H+ antiporter subunit A